MKVEFRKISDEQHELRIVRDNGTVESETCETRSYLLHDLTHFAVESEAKLDSGFWGLLASGRTLEDMNDRSGASLSEVAPSLWVVEAVVGALHSVATGKTSPEALLQGLQAQGEGLGWPLPDWLTPELVSQVKERLRSLTGHWQATAYGESMSLHWPPSHT